MPSNSHIANFLSHRKTRWKRSSALIIVLTVIVLLTIVVVAFLSQSIITRQMFVARSGQTQADLLGASAVEYMKADLREEIVAGSQTNATLYQTNSTSWIYVPTTNYTVVPARTGFVPGTTASDPYANIVKVSRYATNFYAGVGYDTTDYPPPNYASPVSTSTPSLNGRVVDSSAGWTLNGWDRPQLIDTGSYTSALASAPMPDWIYVTTSGRKVLAAPEADIVGRYSYVVYDEGGLLDINSAGYNSSLSTADVYDVARKGSLGLADLTQIPGISGANAAAIRDALVAWRNATTSSSSYSPSTNSYPTNSPAYLQYLVDGGLNKGFLSTYPGDQKFLSRQDLIDYQVANASGTAGLPAQALAYLGTFTRTINAPTYTPVLPVSVTESFTPVQSPAITYENNAENSQWSWGNPSVSVMNRDVINVRWESSGTLTRPVLSDDTGTMTEKFVYNKGDPLVQHRFPLSKIALLSNPLAQTSNPLTPGTVAWTVNYYFGLEWVASDTILPEPHWEYTDANSTEGAGTPSAGGTKYINSLQQVADLAREPNFFEMLREGILAGSAGYTMVYDIGTSVIDQADTDDTPTVITEGPGHYFFGRENLPYLSQMMFWPYRPKGDRTRQTLEAFLIPVVWNPHRNASSASTTEMLRVLAYQTLAPNGIGDGTAVPAKMVYSGTNAYYTVPGLSVSVSQSYAVKPAITFANSPTFAEPTILTRSTGTLSNMPGASGTTTPLSYGDAPKTRIGFYLGATNAAYDKPTAIAAGVSSATYSSYPTCTSGAAVGGGIATDGTQMTFRMQLLESDGNWHTYDEKSIAGFNEPGGGWAATETLGASTMSTTGAFTGTLTSVPSFSGLTSGDAYYYLSQASFGCVDPRVNNFLWSPGRLNGGQLWQTAIQGTVGTGFGLSSISGSSFRPSKDWSNSYGIATGDYPSSDLNFGTPTLGMASSHTQAFVAENSSAVNTGSVYYDWVNIASSGGNNLDGDGINRPGDNYRPGAGYTSSTGPFPMAANNPNDRPIILNRPFLSVGELGYTFRGLEFKTLDFSSATSGDAGLLDLFSINDTENANQKSMISGVVDINTRNPSVLQAIISGGLINGLDSTGAGITSTDAASMANAIVTETVNNKPLLNRAELANRIVPLSGIANVLTADSYYLKDKREAVVRTLAEPSDTRTWNLLIDLVVQAGRYPTNAIQTGSSALGQFDVQGERHYWLHIALDRYTGTIIDEQLEVVHND